MSDDPTRLEQLADLVVERLAPLVAELVREELRNGHHDQGLVGPDEIARRLKRSVDWVRDHADELGVIRLGDGPKARLWFRIDDVEQRLRAREAEQTKPDTPQLRPRKRTGRTASGAELLDYEEAPNRKRQT